VLDLNERRRILDDFDRIFNQDLEERIKRHQSKLRDDLF
jgi:hypothetical protein